jgi:hypothetical protein
MKRFLVITLLVLISVSQSNAQSWEYLFNGKNLDGWKTMGEPNWAVKDGVITVDDNGKEMGFLYYDKKQYTDFVFHAQFKWTGGNSGIQFRSRIEDDKMIGYQANVDPSRETATGTLVEEYGRGALKKNVVKASEIFKKDEWNHFEITCIGTRIYLYVNGIRTTALNDKNGDSKGIFALQMDPKPGASMQWKDIRVLEIPNKKFWARMFDGRSLKGWKTLGDSTWTVEDKTIIGKSKDGGYGWLLSEKEYSNFYFSTLFKIDQGNSGIQFRSWPKDNMVLGYQADINVGSNWITGHLYEQSTGRGSLVKPDFDVTNIIDPNAWNTYEITAMGTEINLFINGIKTVTYTEKDLVDERTKGIFAFQIHQGNTMATQWKDIRIIEFE